MAARTETKLGEYSFNDIEKMLLRNEDDVTPRETVTDYRLVAGLLFHRYNDDTRRHIRIENGKPTLIVRWVESFTAFPPADFPVDPKAVEYLLAERCLEGTPEMGYTDMKKLRLTKHGMRMVLQQWISGAGFHDFFEAGGSLDMRADGQAHWPRAS